MPRTSRPMSIFPITVRTLTVAAIDDLTPHMRRLTLEGPQLGAGERDGVPVPAFRSDGFDDHIKLIIPGADGSIPDPGTQEGERFAWNPGVLPLTRDYTVRRVDLDHGRIEVDFVVHESGAASDWVRRCQIGDEIAFAGPKASARITPDVDWHLLVGDETALPAIARWLEEATADMRAIVIVEIPSDEDRQDLPTRATADFRWLVRPADVRPGYSPLLGDAVRALDFLPGRVYAWCAGEALTMAPIRRFLRNEKALPKDDVEVVGYWRRIAEDLAPEKGTAPAPEAASAPAAPAPIDYVMQAYEMTELLAPVAIRAAVTLGLFHAVNDARLTRDGLADTLGIEAVKLSALVDALLALGILREADGTLSHTALGEMFLDELADARLSLDNPANRVSYSIVHLLDELRGAAPTPIMPARVRQWRGDGVVDRAFMERAEEELEHSLQPLIEHAALAGASRILVAGSGTAATIGELVKAGRSPVTEGDADAAILQFVLDDATDAEAIDLVRDLRARVDGAIVVVTSSADGAEADDHVAEDALAHLTATGVPLRTSAQLVRLFAEAGLDGASAEPLGWGFGPSLVVAPGRAAAAS